MMAMPTFTQSHGLTTAQPNDYVRDLQLIMKTANRRAELYPFMDYIGLLPLPQIRDTTYRMQRITEYGKQSMDRLRLAQASGNLNTPIFFSKLMNPKNTDDALTEAELNFEAAEFMITGTETTSNVLTYLVWAVCRHPEVRKTMQDEVAQLPWDFKDSDVSKLKYLPCVIKEALRLYGTAAGALPRRLPNDGWTVDGYFLPRTTTVVVQPYSAHRREDTFHDALR